MYIWMITWGIIFVITVIAELNTMQLISVWFSVGSLAAFFAAVAGVSPLLQITIFTAASILLLAVTRPILKKFKVGKITPTNLDAEIGRTATVIVAIDPDKDEGRVKLRGVNWKARTSDGTALPEGTLVKVDRIDGTTLYVTRAEQKVSV